MNDLARRKCQVVMPHLDGRCESNSAGGEWFTTTHWSVVLAAGQTASPKSAAALEQLCRTYWQPLYAFVRRQGYSPEDAQDLTQAFFERVLEKHYFDRVDRSKGRFRAFLLAALKHFLSDQRDHERAAKRGGGKLPLSLDAEKGEERYRLEPVDNMSPDKLYDRRWAMTVLDEAAKRVRAEYHASGRGEMYEHLRRHLSEGLDTPTCAETAKRLETTENTVKSWVHRLRQRNRQLVREVIAETVAAPEQIDDELRSLFAALTNT